jgi:hypothetical protein
MNNLQKLGRRTGKEPSFKNVPTVTEPNGDKFYGPPHGTRFYFSSTGKYKGMLWKSADQKAHRKSLTQRLPGTLLENGEPTPLVAALMQLNLQSRGHQLIVTGYLLTILRCGTTATSKKLIAEFSSALKAARRLNGLDKSDIGPKEKFMLEIDELCKENDRLPTYGEMAERFYNYDSAKVSKLAKANGVMLPDEPRPGRGGSI